MLMLLCIIKVSTVRFMCFLNCFEYDHNKYGKNWTIVWVIAHSAGDLNETFFVGNVDEASRQLVQCTYECLEKAIAIGMLLVYIMLTR